jgi:hypothetical protein
MRERHIIEIPKQSRIDMEPRLLVVDAELTKFGDRLSTPMTFREFQLLR